MFCRGQMLHLCLWWLLFSLKLTHCLIYWSHSYTAVFQMTWEIWISQYTWSCVTKFGQMTVTCAHKASTNFQSSRTSRSKSQKSNCQEFRSVFSLSYGKWQQHRGANSSRWAAPVVAKKKASGPLDVYWKTALSDDLCKHFLNEFMGLLTYFWSVLFFPSIIN